MHLFLIARNGAKNSNYEMKTSESLCVNKLFDSFDLIGHMYFSNFTVFPDFPDPESRNPDF